MSTEGVPPADGKGLFGIRRTHVAQIIAEHEVLQRQAEGRAQAAEARIVELEAEVARLRQVEGDLDDARDEVARKQEELAELSRRIEVLEQNSPSASTTKFLNEELGSVLTAAQQAASQVMERANEQADALVSEAKRVWSEVEADRARFAEWREEAEPYIRAVQEKVEGVRAKIEEVPIRIRQALDMVIGAVAAMDTDLAQIMAVPSPPVLQGGVEASLLDLEEPSPESVDGEAETDRSGDRIRVIEGGGEGAKAAKSTKAESA